MSEFKKISIFIIGFAVILLMIHLLLPYYWGNESLEHKLECEEIENSNTYFLGNSKIFHQVIPQLFDSIVSTSGNSFNLATDAANVFESDYLARQLIKEKKADNIIILYSAGFPGIQEHNMNTRRSFYYWNAGYALDLIDFFGDKREKLIDHWKLLFKRYLLLGQGLEILDFTLDAHPDNEVREQICEDGGYYSMGDQYPDRVGDIYKKQKKFLSNLPKQARRNLKLNKNPRELKDDEKVIYTMMNELILFGEENGTRVYPLYLPNSPVYYIGDIENAIYLGDGVEFPEFYDKKYWFDKGHLNGKGARVFTERLAERFLAKNLHID